MKITDENMEAARSIAAGYYRDIGMPSIASFMLSGNGDAGPAVQCTLRALTAAPASAAEPVPIDAFKAIEAESNQLRELCTKHRNKTEKLRQDIAFLLSVIHGMSEATGELPSEDDAAILAEIEEEAGAPFTIDT